MASSNLMALLPVALLLLLPTSAIADDLTTFYDRVCEDVECGRGTCKANISYPLSFTCECETGWTRYKDDFEFLPCVIPNCTLNYSCQPPPPPVPDVEVPHNLSFFDPCYWTYCGEGTCNKTSTYKHQCDCKPGFYNLLNITVFPCYSDCTIGSDCSSLGIKVSNSESSPADGSPAISFLPGKIQWMPVLMIIMAMVVGKYEQM